MSKVVLQGLPLHTMTTPPLPSDARAGSSWLSVWMHAHVPSLAWIPPEGQPNADESLAGCSTLAIRADPASSAVAAVESFILWAQILEYVPPSKRESCHATMTAPGGESATAGLRCSPSQAITGMPWTLEPVPTPQVMNWPRTATGETYWAKTSV